MHERTKIAVRVRLYLRRLNLIKRKDRRLVRTYTARPRSKAETPHLQRYLLLKVGLIRDLYPISCECAWAGLGRLGLLCVVF